MLRLWLRDEWLRAPRRPLRTLPALAAAPVLFGPALVIGGIRGVLTSATLGERLQGGLAVLVGLSLIVLVVTYAIRPTADRAPPRSEGKKRT